LANVSVITLTSLSSESPLTAEEKDQSHLEVVCEYLQSLILAFPETDKPMPPPEFYPFIMGKIKNLIKGYSEFFGLEAATQKYEIEEFKLRHDAIANALYIRGDGYEVHIGEVFLELFGHHDAVLQSEFGFSSHHVIEVFDYVENHIRQNLIFMGSLRDAYVKWLDNNPIEKLLKKYSEAVIKQAGLIGIYEMETKSGKSQPHPLSPFKIYPSSPKLLNVAKALSIQFGENSIFTRNEKFKAEPLADTLIYEKPFIRDEESFYCFNPFLGPRNYFTIAEELLKRVPNNYHKNKFLTNKSIGGRDRYVEDKTLEVFTSLFPDFKFHLNATYTFKEDNLGLKCTISKDGNYEIDLVGIGENVTLLIEIKASTLNKKAKRGSIDNIVSGLKRIIGKAACQAFRAEQFILNSSTPTFEAQKHRFSVDPNKKIYKINISLDHLSSLATRLNALKTLGVIEDSIDYSWCISLFDLLIFRDLLSKDELLGYLDWRLPLYQKQNLEHFDEITLIGYWLSKEINTKIESLDNLFLHSGFSHKIDNYFNSLSTSSPLPKPQKL
jgi:hypothetical protein